MRNLVTCLALLLSLLAPVHAQSPDTVRAVVYEFLRGQAAGLPGEVNIEVDAPRIPPGLGSCARLEPWLPAGTRAWGRLRVGVRCADGSAWALYVPAEIKVVGAYLVAARALRPGEILSTADLAEQRGELTAMGRHLLTDPAQAVGSQMRFAVAAGQPLRATMVAQPVVVHSGRPVKVIVEGRGFRVANQGTALGNGRLGEAVRVRLASGKVVSGTAGENGEVIVKP